MKSRISALILLAAAVLTACDPYKQEIEYLEKEANDVSEVLDEISSSVESLTNIMVAMLGNDFVTEVEPIQEGNRSGYALVFANSGKVIIYCGADGRDGKNGEDGEDGEDGKDGVTPAVSIRQGVDGIWYWTVNGDWLYNSNGARVPVAGKDGLVPKLKISGEFWYISYDNGKSWERVGSSVAGESSVFKSLDYQSYDDYVEFTLKDGTVLQIPKNKPLNLSLYNYSEIAPGETVTLNYSISGYDGKVEMASIDPEGWNVSISPASTDGGTITVTVPDPLVYQTILIFASNNGNTTMRPLDFTPKATDLSKKESANCYLVTGRGSYSFNASIKGCGPDLIEEYPSRATVLWEYTDNKLSQGNGKLIKDLYLEYRNSSYYIKFTTVDSFKEGNAVIALKSGNGTILWSWHIWFSDFDADAEACTYSGHSDKAMMSRNLGAISSSPGKTESYGMLYQWGRKDPFPCNSSISKVSATGHGNTEYTVKNPDKFLAVSSADADWMSVSSDKLWDKTKSIYDPCPPGWQIPEGGTDGIWSGFPNGKTSFDSSNHGITFGTTYSTPKTWYPAAGYIDPVSAQFTKEKEVGANWACSAAGNLSYGLTFSSDGTIKTSDKSGRATGKSIRCCKNPQGTVVFPEGNYDDLSKNGCANSYIVPAGGTYKFRADRKGNSAESFASTPSSAEVIWESFGTKVKPNVGDIVSSVSYKDGYVYMKMASPYREGNALIAVRDRSGKILWSWHIWACPFSPQSGKAAIGGKYYMDRNLGATSAEPCSASSLGLMYQWGRKDPFMGPDDVLSDTQCLATTEFQTEYDYNKPNVYFRISYTTEHPTTYIYCNMYWDGLDSHFWDMDKNKQDPCPPGWKIPESNPFYEITPEWDNRARGAWAGGVWFPAVGHETNAAGFEAYYFFANENAFIKGDNYDSRIAYCSSRNYYTTSWGSGSKMSVRCIEDIKDDAISGKEVLTLGEDERANCYIVSAPGLYRFKANYRGNSTNNQLYDLKDAELLWESDNTDNAVQKGSIVEFVKFSSNYVYFQIPSKMKEGNAVLAVRNNNKEIMWSWHIWVTKYNPEKQSETYASRKDYPTMNRNLGALSNEAGNPLANGLLYQWGRKDPFPGSASKSGDVSAAVSGKSISYISASSVSGDSEYARRNPTYFIYSSTKGGDWQNNNTGLWASIKTENDPCPAGWKVPEGGERGLWGRLPSNVSSLWDKTLLGLSLKSYSTPTAWFPSSGIRRGDSGALTYCGQKGNEWTCTYDTDRAYSMIFDNTSLKQIDEEYGNASGRPVRCMKDYGNQAPVMDYTISREEYFANPGESVRISCKVYPTNAPTPKYTWKSDNTGIATVDSDGLVTAIKEGSCTISATYDGMISSCKFTVKKKTDDRTDLSLNEPANCYMTGLNGKYEFKTYKGNSNELISGIKSVETIWETFNSNITPNAGDVVSNVGIGNGYIFFETGSRSGNAVIAGKNSSGEILWSWHIWVSNYNPDKDYDTYKSGAVMMNRNLGAISNTPGDAGSFGFFYQWGRKDPFPGSSSITDNIMIKTCPADKYSTTDCNSTTGNIDYAIKNPSVFIMRYNDDWLYNKTDDSRWGHNKTIYDPCPSGWRVPDGGENGVWYRVSDYYFERCYDTYGQLWTEFSSPAAWYPLIGIITPEGYLNEVGGSARYWGSHYTQAFYHTTSGFITIDTGNRADGRAVRCTRD